MPVTISSPLRAMFASLNAVWDGTSTDASKRVEARVDPEREDRHAPAGRRLRDGGRLGGEASSGIVTGRRPAVPARAGSTSSVRPAVRARPRFRAAPAPTGSVSASVCCAMRRASAASCDSQTAQRSSARPHSRSSTIFQDARVIGEERVGLAQRDVVRFEPD